MLVSHGDDRTRIETRAIPRAFAGFRPSPRSSEVKSQWIGKDHGAAMHRTRLSPGEGGLAESVPVRRPGPGDLKLAVDFWLKVGRRQKGERDWGESSSQRWDGRCAPRIPEAEFQDGKSLPSTRAMPIQPVGSAGPQFGGFRLIPSALMREARVVGLIPSNSAAPSTPKILPPVCCRAAMMLSRS